MRKLLALVLLLSGSAAAAQFRETKGPVSPEGIRAAVDLPTSQQHRNVGGSDGAGLCVYTSAWHAAIWQDVREVFEFRAWMQRRPGGSWPEKFDATLRQYCAEKGVPVPGYVQHTGGDVEFLKTALRTGRLPCVTYCGVDGPGRYGSEVVAHMVNVVHLDDRVAAILDNNFPGALLWMPAAEFVGRWRGEKADGRPYYIGRQKVGGGWAIVFLAPPPPPYPAAPVAVAPQPHPPVAVGAGCVCGDACECAPGKCPGGCPVAYGQTWTKECGPDGCRIVKTPAAQPQAAQPQPPGNPPSPDYLWREWPGVGWGWVHRDLVKDAPAAAKPEPAAPVVVGTADPFPGGVDPAKLDGTQETYAVNGVPVPKVEAIAALLSDDSGKWNLTAVGDPAFLDRVRKDVSALPADVRGKLHCHAFAPDAWQVAQFRLDPGVTLRKPAVGRVGADVGHVAAAAYGADTLANLFELPGGPVERPRQPKPGPKVEPAPPGPQPAPQPNPQPQPEGSFLAVILAAVLAWLAARWKK